MRKKKKVSAIHPTVAPNRVLGLAVVMTMVFGAFTFRVIDLQATPDERLETVSGGGPRTYDLIPSRGDVLDRNGNALAISLPSATVIADQRLIEDPMAVAVTLSPLLGDAPSVIADKLTGEAAFAYIDRQVDTSIGEAITALELPGISVRQEPRREHPNGTCSGIGVVGRVDIDGNGISGLEKANDDELAGVPGKREAEIASDGATIPGAAHTLQPTVEGKDLLLTLDRNLQFRAEELLKDTVEAEGAERGILVASLVETGEVIAMANVDRNDNGVVDCTSENLAVTWAFEPGSIIKPATMAGVLDAGLRSENVLMNVPYSITRWDHDFRDSSFHEEVMWSPTDILAHSSNVGTILMAESLGASGLHDTLADFGLGRHSALEFTGESAGILLDGEDWNGLTLSNNAIGQGVATTAVQMLQIYNTIGNDGIAIDPILRVDQIGQSQQRRVVSATTAQSLQRMMETVVTDGTGKAAAIDGYVVEGKTGTSWQPCDGLGYFCDDGTRHYTASFGANIGNDTGPKLSVIVVIDDPVNETSGGLVAAPVVAEFGSYAMQQLRIAPEATPVDGELIRVVSTTHPAEAPTS